MDLLQLRQLRIGLLPHLSMVVILERTRLRPPTQLFQPLSHLIPGRFASITMFTVWAVDSQEGQQRADPTVMMGAGCEHHGLIALESGSRF
jgi:hypothetical protein